MSIKTTFRLALAALALSIGAQGALAQDHRILVQSTTSTANSGLYDYLLPIFEEKTGIDVQVVAVGTGQALKNARNGDGDVLLVHAKPAEEKFVAEGFGVKRSDLMYNDFVIVGPAADPAGLAAGGKPSADVAASLGKIRESGAIFASRGDDSGTHKKEKALWGGAGGLPGADSAWYRETGSGMGATLNAAVGMDAYTMTDRATWISFGNKAGHKILVEGDPALFNQYGVILVNPEKHPGVNAADGQKFIDWLLSEEGQQAIGAYRMNGEQLFTPNAN